MTNKEIVKWLQSLKSEIGKQNNQHLWNYAEVLDMAIKALQGDEWIPVSDGLPVKNRLVLVTVPYKYLHPVTVARCNGDKRHYAGYTYPDGDVLAWMPLPEPYREEDEE